MRVAVVHDWLVTLAGAERVLGEILRLFPQADLFTVIDFLADSQRELLLGKTARTTFIQSLPFARSRYRWYLSLMPLAIEQLDLSGYDLVLSSSYAVAKGVLTGPDQVHISYVHSPMRYVWDLQQQYLRDSTLGRGPLGWLTRWQLSRLRIWDQRTAHGVDAFAANSAYIARRIRKAYGREASIIHPPVDTERFTPGFDKEGYYVTVSRLVPYKRVDLIAEAFARMPQRRLLIVGDGPERAKIAAKAAPNVELLGEQPFEQMHEILRRARAFVFAAEEDFGIAPIEAQACGLPVIAFGRG